MEGVKFMSNFIWYVLPSDNFTFSHFKLLFTNSIKIYSKRDNEDHIDKIGVNNDPHCSYEVDKSSGLSRRAILIKYLIWCLLTLFFGFNWNIIKRRCWQRSTEIPTLLEFSICHFDIWGIINCICSGGSRICSLCF